MSSESNISSASESRFQAAHYSEPLTAFTAGYQDNENLKELLDFIAPAVPVARRFEFKKAKNAQAFLSETDDIRTIGSAFKRVEYNGESVNEKTHNKGLTIRVDHDEISDDNWKERYVHLLVQRLYRNEIRRALGILNAAAKGKDIKWSKDGNPDADVRNALRTAADKSGIRPNRILFGEAAWDARMAAFESKDHAAAFRAADLAPGELANKLLVEQIHVASGRFQRSQFKNDKEAFVGNSIFAFFAENGLVKDEPSNLKRFITPTDHGSDFRVYLEESSKYTDITVEHYSNIVVTSDLGIQKLSVTSH